MQNDKEMNQNPPQEEAKIPENAFRELKEGEKYVPVLRPDKEYPEVTPYSVSLGLLLAVIFSAAAAYLGLRIGQVFEAAIPIAIIAVGLSSAMKRRNALGENVIIQSIGASSGIVVAGAIFTLPALYILQAKYPEITVNFLEVFLSSLLGGVLGILFFIPFRKYFCSDMHGKFPFPEATATTQVLISGEKGGNQARPLVFAGLIGGVYDFLLSTFGWWTDTLTTKILPWGNELATNAKMVFKINTQAAVLGLGYIVGLKYSFIIFAGSAFIWFVIIPLLGMSPEYASLAPEQIFSDQARYIGIGGIAMSGIIGIIKSWPIIKNAVGLAGKEFKGKESKRPRIMVTGCPNMGVRDKIIKNLEELGADCVVIDTCNGIRTQLDKVREDTDVYTALAEKYLNVTCSVMSPNKPRFEEMGVLLDEFKVDAVVEIVLQACHTFNIETYNVKRYVTEEKGLPYMSLETDYSQSDKGQITTRLEAFIEMLM